MSSLISKIIGEILEERDHKNAHRIWLVPANPNEYDIESAGGNHEVKEK